MKDYEIKIAGVDVSGSVIEERILFNNPKSTDREIVSLHALTTAAQKTAAEGRPTPCAEDPDKWTLTVSEDMDTTSAEFEEIKNQATQSAGKCHGCPIFRECEAFRKASPYAQGVFAGVWMYQSSSRKAFNDIEHHQPNSIEQHLRNEVPFRGCWCGGKTIKKLASA